MRHALPVYARAAWTGGCVLFVHKYGRGHLSQSPLPGLLLWDGCSISRVKALRRPLFEQSNGLG